MLRVRPAPGDDVPTLLRMIRELAQYLGATEP